MPRFSWLVPPPFFLGRLVVCVYVWVVCSACEGGSRPLLLVCLLVMGVFRFRERASVVVAGFGRGWWACSGASGSSCRLWGLRRSRVCSQTVCLCWCLRGVSMVFVYLLPCDLVVLSGGFVLVFGDDVGAGVVVGDCGGEGILVAGVFLKVVFLFVGR